MAVTALISGFAAMTALSIATIFGRSTVVSWLGATPTTAAFAEEYALYILLAAPFMVGANILNQQLRYQGSANIAMVGTLSGAVLNIALDPLLIYVLDLGVAGAAIATMISQMVSFCILLLYGTTRGENIRMRLPDFAPSKGLFYEILRGGLPSLLRQAFASIATIVVNHAAGGYGDAALAAYSIVNRICMFANSLILGFGQGFQPVCGFNYGAKLYRRVREAFWFSTRYILGGLVLSAGLLAIFAPQVVGIFRDDPDVIRIGALSLRLNCITLALGGWTMICNMLTQTMGMIIPASVIAITRQGLFLIPAVLVLSRILGLFGIQLSTPVAETCAFLMTTPIGLTTLRRLKRDEQRQEVKDA
jgi:putative MATE family efflux protein